MDVVLLLAIFRRLTGLPLDSSGRPVLRDGVPANIEGSSGLRIPAMDSSRLSGGKVGMVSMLAPAGAGSSVQAVFRQNSYKQVPIFIDGLDNRAWEDVYPSCSVSYADVRPGDDGNYFSQTGDGGNIITNETGSLTVTDPDTGEVLGTTPDTVTVRPHPRPYVLEIVFTLQAKNLIEMMMLERALLAMWDGKLGLVLHQFNNQVIRADYQFSRYIVMDQGEPYDPQKGVDGTAPAALRRGFVFTFETWLDNSVAGYNLYEMQDLATVLESYLEVCNIRDKGLDYADMTVVETKRIG